MNGGAGCVRTSGGGTAVAVRLAGGAPLREVLGGAEAGDWLVLDAAVREVAWYRSRLLPEWEHTDPLPAELTHLGESRLALALCHRDGRVREAAVRRSARCPGLLPLIVIRCADWAEPVRERARELLREALDARTAVDLAPLILRVGCRDRGAFGIGLLEEVLGRASAGGSPRFSTTPSVPCGGSVTGWPSGTGFLARRAGSRGRPGPGHGGPGSVRHRGSHIPAGRGGCLRRGAHTTADCAQSAYPFGRASPRCGGRDGRSRRRCSSSTAPLWYVPAPGTWCGSTEAIRRPGTGSGVRHRMTLGCRPVWSSGLPSAETARTPVCCGRCSPPGGRGAGTGGGRAAGAGPRGRTTAAAAAGRSGPGGRP